MAKKDFSSELNLIGTIGFPMQADAGESAGATETAGADTEPAKRKVADHWLIDADGNKVDDEEVATGIGYQVVGSKAPFTFQTGQAAGTAAAMLAVFGAKTLATNESSAARNRKDDPADADGQMEAVAERFALIGTGKWVDRTREGVGAKIDLDALAGAIIAVAEAADPSKVPDYAKVRQKLEEDVGFRKTVRQVPAIATEYANRAGRPAKTLADALGDLLS
jgi:hypothetical protein